MKEPYEPNTPQVFWCNQCDNWTVDSEKPDTGNFFVVFGHAFSQKEKEYSGDYTGVMYAVCKRCLN